MTVTEYHVSGMTCGHCEQSVREEVTGVDGVTQIEVSAATGRLVVTSAAPVPEEAIVAAVKEAGYGAVRTESSPEPSTSTSSSCGCC
ncbi:heavy metal transporter [Mycobacterium dioxanotrophicus]|jgi:copper chaperone|uniref:Heavy metal transporter n=1 Tax=Mycobacterium dioxanotrophicus TaxID=482462 RepID=A0A1Y0C6E3_9MYCO|nr:heavy-metal-associated domain-containing protein [Mycobacterium dioxanotrophicus]ART70626.1 heavy metal transporter [Mycobacterium dioxanotrophicus]